MRFNYPICQIDEGKSIKEYLLEFHLGKSKINKLFAEKNIYINNNQISERYILRPNDVINIDYLEQRDFLPDKKKLDIVYEDDYLLIINKPYNIIVHPDDKNKNNTICNIVSYYYQNKQLDLTIKYAHRLDTDTTGLLIFVKDSLTLAKIADMIAKHELKRTYLCLVNGTLKDKKGMINLPIGEDRHHKQRRRVSKTGQEAITYYEVIKEYKKYSLVRVNLKTGRTHQIRVHFSHIGHPLLGDKLYYDNSNLATRVMLHSYMVEFIHPVYKKAIKVVKELPFDMKKLI